jgi:magnesium chelatase family protein
MNNQSDFSDIRGMTPTVTTFAAAVQRGERILLIAGSGSGAVSMASRAAGLLPQMTKAEASQVSAVQDDAGMRETGRRPFRAPHHTCSWAGMFTRTRSFTDDEGNAFKRKIPGEVALAKHGVLLLDEATEFRSEIVSTVGVVLDDSTLLIARVLPCPCGMDEHPHKSRCTCTEAQRYRWVGRLGRLAADLDITCTIEVPFLSNEARAHGERCPSTSDLLTQRTASMSKHTPPTTNQQRTTT